MAKDWEDGGWTKYANDVMKAKARIRIPGQAGQVFDAVMSLTWRYHKKEDTISLGQLCEATGMEQSHVIRGRKKLVDMNMLAIHCQKRQSDSAKYRINRHFDRWKPLSKKTRGVSKKTIGGVKKDNSHCQKRHTPKNNIKKNIRKKRESPSGDHQTAIDYFCQKYKDRYGFDYDFQGAKDGAIIGRMLKRWKFDGLKILIDQLFESTDPFYEKGGGRTLGVLKACANKLAQEAQRRFRGQDKLSTAGEATARAAAKILEQGCKKKTKQLSSPS